MYRFAFELQDFERLPLEDRLTFLQLVVEALAIVDRAEMRTNPRVPRSLYRAGVAYVRDRDGDEVWKDISRALSRHAGDCKDFVAWRLAELREAGEDDARVEALAETTPAGRIDYHVRIRRANGDIEDPSIALGMNRSPPR